MKKEKTKKDVMLVPTNSAEALISQAINKGVSVETMEKLLTMRRELKAEAAKDAFNRAMAAFQAACPVIIKTTEVRTDSGKLAYRYAPIDSIVGQVKKLIQDHGFSYSIDTETTATDVKSICRVTHELGHSETSQMTVPIVAGTKIMSSSQKVAASLTFAKRYAFCNAFGILTGDEDTDAEDQEPPKSLTDSRKANTFELTKKFIAESKHPVLLIDMDEKAQKSDKFTAEEKVEIHKLVNAKVDELTPKK